MLQGRARRTRARWLGVGLAPAAAIALLIPATARASTGVTTDRNDVAGKLDIRSVTQEHAAVGPVVHTITTYGSWRSRTLALRRGSYLVVEFDTKGGRRPERVAFVYRSHGSLRVAVVSRAGQLIGWGTASRPSTRSIRIAVPRKLLGKPLGYRWKVFSVYIARGACRSYCVDRAPDRGSVLHDITAPAITFAPIDPPADTTTSVPFAVSDGGGSGLAAWSVESRQAGDTAWTVAATGATAGTHSVSVTGSEGQTLEVRVVARDRGGNVTTSPTRQLTYAVDDSNAQMSYAGTWTTASADSLDYHGTLHTSSDTITPATVTFSFQGTTVAILARGSCGSASVAIDGVDMGPVTQLCGGEHRAVVFTAAGLNAVAHTVTLTVAGGTFEYDGAVVR